MRVEDYETETCVVKGIGGGCKYCLNVYIEEAVKELKQIFDIGREDVTDNVGLLTE